MTQRNCIRLFYITMGCIPLVWLIMVLIGYLKVSFEIGYFPNSEDQYTGLHSYFFRNSKIDIVLMVISMWGTIVVPLIIVGHFVFAKFKSRMKKPTIGNIILGYIGYVVFIICWTVPVIDRMVAWHID